ncbi:retrotransposon protein, putative, ty1-copia subclass, partial [Tanacetum coccineum]
DTGANSHVILDLVVMDNSEAYYGDDALHVGNEWRQAMKEEYDALMKNETWSLVPRASNTNVVDGKWVYRLKQYKNGVITRYKAIFVAKGFWQQPSIDFHKTFILVIKSTTIRAVLSLPVTNDWPLRQLYIHNAILHGNLKEQAQALGLSAFPRLSSISFSKAPKRIHLCNNKGTIDNIICQLGSAFALKYLGPLNYFLGIEIVPHVFDILLSQKKYILELLQSAGLSNCNPVSSPMVTSSSLSLDDSTAFAVNNVCQYMHAPTENHWSTVKRILRYLHGTVEHGMLIHRSSGSALQAFTDVLWKGNPNTSLEAFSDVDWARDSDDRRYLYKSITNSLIPFSKIQAVGNFPTVFCLKINHGGAFTKPLKIRYKGGEVNWIDNIDSDDYSVNEVSDMMKNIGYDNVAMEYYLKEPNTELDKGLRKLATDSDTLEMLKFVPKYMVIDLYVEHPVSKEPMNIDHPVSEAIMLYEPNNLDEFLYNDVDEVLDDVNALRKLLRFSQTGGQSSNNVDNVGQFSKNVDNVVQARKNKNVHNLVIIKHVANEGNAVSEHESESEYGSDSDDSDFIVDEENLIHDVAVDMQDFNSNTDANVEWMCCKESVQEVNEVFHAEEDIDFEDFDSGTELDNEEKEHANSQLIKDMVTRVYVEQRRELHLKKNDKLGVRVICKGKLPVFDGPSVDDGPIEASGPDKSNKGTNDSGNLKSKKGSEDSNRYPWVLQCYKLKNEETWKVKTFDDIHNCLQSRTVKKCKASFLSKEVKETIEPNPTISQSALKDQLKNDFSQLMDYCLELKRKIPNTIVKIDVDRSGATSGQILTAVDIDSNNAIYLLAYELVESYWLPTWQDMYRFKVNPVDGPDLWPKSNLPCILTPPKFTPQPGWLKKKRSKIPSKLANAMTKGLKLTKEAYFLDCKEACRWFSDSKWFLGYKCFSACKEAYKRFSACKFFSAYTNYINRYGFTKKDD